MVDRVPSNLRPSRRSAPSALGALLLFEAFSAFAGGIYGLTGADGVPREWLHGSPFSDYVVPSAALFVIVGGAQLLAGLAVVRRRPHASASALVAGVILLGWIALQMAVIGHTSWLQPFTIAVALLIVVLAVRLMRQERRSERAKSGNWRCAGRVPKLNETPPA